jgi:3-phenylpropionate/cinnamic acid dioxygenase small subunit
MGEAIDGALDLEAESRRRRDRLAIEDLALGYATTVDQRDRDGFVNLFTEDGELSLWPPGADRPEMTFRRRDRLAEVISRLDGVGATMHVMSNHRIELAGNVATGVVYCRAYHLLRGASGSAGEVFVMVIQYRDRYVRTPDGWRIGERLLLRQWNELSHVTLRPLVA